MILIFSCFSSDFGLQTYLKIDSVQKALDILIILFTSFNVYSLDICIYILSFGLAQYIWL